MSCRSGSCVSNTFSESIYNLQLDHESNAVRVSWDHVSLVGVLAEPFVSSIVCISSTSL